MDFVKAQPMATMACVTSNMASPTHTRRRLRRLHASARLGRVSIQFRGVGVASATLPTASTERRKQLEQPTRSPVPTMLAVIARTHGRPDLQFYDAIASWPGSAHDSRIFDSSRARVMYETGAVTGILLGDMGYACRSYLMTPLKDPQ
ncbi:hypothetical protein HPB50_011526 [Hyalomma asiaticum]|uniref:Uncharacterized protein n=1 Tax=Hyalomma asiaticum TaxID=266040 RepID=A0ACB7T6X4_HYAAI|nr:hypothetical protein HPB50_011526 [Hyalomma asiaticum]